MKNDEHITQDELIMAVIDKTSLTPEKRDHLDACRICGSQAERLGRDLTSLGDMVKAVVPPMRTAITLPEAEVREPARPWWGMRLAYGSALAAALVVLILAVPVFRVTPDNKMEVMYQNILSDAKLMLEIDRMVEDPMPDAWAASYDESEAGEDEDSIDDIVPGGDDLS